MSSYANKHLHYVMDLEYTLSRISEAFHHVLKYPEQSIDSEFILIAFSFLPDEYEQTFEIKSFLDFLHKKRIEKEELEDDIRELWEGYRYEWKDKYR